MTTKTKIAKTSNIPTEADTTVNVKEFYSTTKQINAAIDMAVKVGNNLQIEYQKIACSVIKHLDTHKDIRIVRHLLNTIPEGMRKKSMSAFFDKYAAVTFAMDDDTGKPVVTYDKDKQSKLTEATVSPWWKAATESEYKPFDLVTELAKLMKRAEGKLKKGIHPESGDNVSIEQVAQISALIVQMSNQEAQAA